MQTMLMIALLAGTDGDFTISDAGNNQIAPCLFTHGDQYYVFWSDLRDYSTRSLAGMYVARISRTGQVLDYNGKLVFLDSTRDEGPRVAFDGTNFLAVVRNGC